MPVPSSAEATVLPQGSSHERFRITERLPLTLHVVFWALIAAAAANIVFNGVGLIGFNAASYVARTHEIEALNHETRLPDSKVLSGFVVVLILIVLLAAAEVVLAFLVRRGRNGARIVVTVFLGLGVVQRVAQQPTGPAFVFAFFLSALALAIVWLLWMPSSNRYIRAAGAARKRYRSERLAAEPLHPAAWVPDPSGRHQYRYWDGAEWTHHVGDDGVGAVDPLHSEAPPSTP